jgi:hypothetical protein
MIINHPLLLSKGCKPRKGIIRQCALCGVDVYVRPCRRRFKNSFCCRDHSQTFLKSKAFSFKCVICCKQVFTQPIQMRLRNRKTCSLICRAKLQTRKAEKSRLEHPPTEGALRRRIRYSKKMHDWRRAVFVRDNYTCQLCGARSGKGKAVVLNADHIKSFAQFPELRFELSNGRTLCVTCHRKTPTFGRRKGVKEKPTHS